MSTHVIIPVKVAKAFIAPLLLAIARAAQLCTTQSARELTNSGTEIWDIIDAHTLHEDLEMEEEGDHVNMTKAFLEIQLEVARMCSFVDAEDEDSVNKSWTYIITGFRLFDAALISYIRSEQDSDLKNAEAFDEYQGLFAEYPTPSNTLH